MTTRVRLLSVEDDENDDVLVRRELRRGGIEVTAHRRVDTLAGLADALQTGTWDVCVCDFNLVVFDAIAALDQIRLSGRDLPTLVVTGSLDEEHAGTIFRAGARDLITKGRLGRLVPAVHRELREAAARAEAAGELRASQELFGAIVGHLPAIIVVRDADDRYQFVNGEFLGFFGLDAAAVLGKTAAEVFGPDVGEQTRRASDLARQTDVHTETTQRFKRFDGEDREYNVLDFRVGADTGLVASIAFDVTERSEAERALRESEERFRALADAMVDAMLTLTVGGEIRYANPAAERLLGYSRAALCAMPLRDLVAPEDRADQASNLARLGAGDAPPVFERRLFGNDGAAVPVEVSTATFTVHGEPFITAILRDLRARRVLEEQFRHAQKMEAVGQLASGIAHDFNNILAVISAYAELLWDGLDGDALQDDVEEIRVAGRRGAALVSQLLTFARKETVHPALHEVDAVVRGMESMLRRAAGSRIQTSFQLEAPGCSVLIDRGHLEQVLMNLVVNAHDALAGRPEGAPRRIVISTSLRGPGDIALSVTDNGAGMDEATRGRIFEPFFTTKGEGKGTGLGLSTVHGIVEQAGGRIDVVSAPGQGSAFSIVLPRGVSPRTPAPAEADPSPPVEGEHRAPSATIVLVEGDGPRVGVARVLRREGHNVIEVRRAEHALGLVGVLEGDLDLVIADVALPGMGGLALSRAIAAAPRPVPVLLMSELERDVSDDEAPLWLHKPIAADELVAQVRSILASGPRRIA